MPVETPVKTTEQLRLKIARSTKTLKEGRSSGLEIAGQRHMVANVNRYTMPAQVQQSSPVTKLNSNPMTPLVEVRSTPANQELVYSDKPASFLLSLSRKEERCSLNA